MFSALLLFDLRFFAKNKFVFLLPVCFTAFGIIIGLNAGFSFPNTYKNAPFTITYILALLSMAALIPAAILAAQTVIREKDSGFDKIINAAPINKLAYMASRFIILSGINILCFALLTIGLFIGHKITGANHPEIGPSGFINYLFPFIVFSIPAILFCSSILSSVAWLTQNKLLVYVTALGIYIVYMITAIFSGSGFIAGNDKNDSAGAAIAPFADPFGLSAFLEQTQYWSSIQRNTTLVSLSNELLINRLLILSVSIIILIVTFKRFSFSLKNKNSKSTIRLSQKESIHQQPKPEPNSIIQRFQLTWRLKALVQLTSVNLKISVKSIPFILVSILWSIILIMEIITSEISDRQRLPEYLATSGIMVENILEVFPIIGLITVLFFGSEVFWKSQFVRFSALENSTPVSGSLFFLSRWLALSAVPVLLLSIAILIGITIQFIWSYPDIDIWLYASIYFFAGLPLVLSALFTISIHAIVNNKYAALAITTVFLAVTNTSLSNLLGANHPLLRWANPFEQSYSPMNGFGSTPEAFQLKMIYWTSIAIIIALLCYWVWIKKLRTNLSRINNWGPLFILAAIAISSGSSINNQFSKNNIDSENDVKQQYEIKYSKYKTKEQPVITDVITKIDLFPEEYRYEVSGEYKLLNKSQTAQTQLIFYFDRSLNGRKLEIENAGLLVNDSIYGYYLLNLQQPLLPGNTLKLKFSFSNFWSAFSENDPFNAIVKNGTFIRISRYFPTPGYNPDNEIADEYERKKRNLPPTAAFPKLSEQDTLSGFKYNYINLDATISTSSNQTVIGTGDLANQWKANNRNYFRYKTTEPIPFRFAVASALYACKKHTVDNLEIEVYYHPEHAANINHLIKAAEITLRYCQKSFGACPHKTIRFAEISEYARGFAATAYPGSFFINENFGFGNKLSDNSEKDIICELTAHELSHIWWGNAQIDPVYGEGSKLMTETLAMYTELMIFKKIYGEAVLKDRVLMHRDLYLSQRSYAVEEPLFISAPDKPYLCYNKGLVVMYQLYLLLGEDSINKALHSFLHRYRSPNIPPVSTDLIHEFYAVSDSSQHTIIDELFKKIIIHSLSVSVAETSKTSSGYQLLFTGKAEKFSEDGNGKQLPVAFSESIDVLILFTDGTTAKTQVKSISGTIHSTINLPKQPLSIELDPDVKFMEVQINDNRRMVNMK
jgi:ABC-2 type transport system permease protein